MPKANTMVFFMEQIVTGQSSHALQPAQAYHTHCLASLSPTQGHTATENGRNKQGFNICECIHQECILPDFFLLTMKLEFLC